MILSVNQHDLYVEVSGPEHAPALVLLHHGLGAVVSWEAQVPVLLQAGWRVINYDRWGYGSSAPRPGWDIPDFAQDIADLQSLLDLLQVRQAALVGHSDGGTIALGFAARWPERVTHLVTVAAHVFVEPLMAPGMDAVYQAYQEKERFRNALAEVHGSKASHVMHHWYQGWRQPANLTWDLRPQLAQIACPALVVQGAKDEYATPQHALALAAALAQARLIVFPEAAHMLPQDEAESFSEALLAFLAQPVALEI